MKWLRRVGLVVVSAAAMAVVIAVAGGFLLARLWPVVQGQWPAAGGAVHWVVDFDRRQWRVTSEPPAGGAVAASGTLAAWRSPAGEIVIRDVKAGPLTISTTARWTAAWTLWPPGLEGTIATTGTTANRQPVSESSARWRITPRRLVIHEATLGAHCRLAGSVGWAPPHPLDLSADLRDADAARVAAVIEPGKTPLAGGIVTGRVAVTGPLAAPRLHGALTARDGKLGATPFDSAEVQFNGQGTIIRFVKAHLRQASTLVAVEGFLDVAKLGTSAVFQDMRLIPQALTPSASDRQMALSRRGD
ncbi:MAG: hypothetical protein HY600_06485 [Candidatus Omnitrophica bacterium]|nr:hypothetical protein [Candidatus Omnitrophota bacterium]